MKTKLTLLALLISIISIAQNGINYKALIKDANGNVIANQSIDMVFSIQHESITQFNELQQIVTDDNGIAIATIGEGSAITGTFDAIDWKLRQLELNVQIDLGNGLIDFGNTPFNAVPYAINTLKPQGLEALDQGNGIGWRLADRNSDSYGNVGLNAVDLSISSLITTDFGAKGQNSFAAGFQNEASGAASTALGVGNIASGNISTAFGNGTLASALNSTTLGVSTQATGNVSTALGYQTVASGLMSTALGSNTRAESNLSFAIGRYNVGGGNPSVWDENDPLFEIGNGTSINNRGNVLTVYKNGRILLNSSTNGILVNSGFGANSENTYGIYVSGGNEYGGYFFGEETAIFAEANNNSNPDIILGGDIGNANDDGIIASDPSYAESDIYLRSNDAVVIELDNDNSGSGSFIVRDSDDDNLLSINKNGTHVINSNANGINITSDGIGLSITNSGSNGILVTGSQTYGASITGDDAGIRARASNPQNPDIILRGNSSANASDDGIIASDPNYAGSDIYLRSNDALVVELDNDNNGSGSFLIRNGNQDVILDVTESGNLSFDGTLELGTGVMESLSPDIRIESNDDALIVLDNDNNESGFFGIYNGSVSASNVVFQIIDSGDAFLAGNLTQASDQRLKRDIEDLSYGLKEILQLNPKQYYWKDQIKNKKSLGLIAQEVKPIIENIVNTQENEEKTLGISYTELIPVLINAIKEQNKIIESQGEALKASHTNYEALLSRIEIIESKTSN